MEIGIVGFGNFGQFLAKTFVKQGHRVIGVSRSDYTAAAQEIGAEYVSTADALMDANPDVVIFATSITSMASVLVRFPLHRLANCLVVDVLSVKLYPKNLLLEKLPPSADILCTHPMFGPESGRHGWTNLPFVYDKVRTVDQDRVDRFLTIWEREQCTMVPMACNTHDSYAASTQFITHTTGRLLDRIGIHPTPINTKGYESLMSVVDSTCKDSMDLYYGLYRYNPNSRDELQKLERALSELRNELEEKERREEAAEKGSAPARM